MPRQLARPEAANRLEASSPLTPEQVARWRDEGWLLVEGLFPRSLVAAAREALDELRPGPLGRSNVAYPTRSVALNELMVHPRLVAAGADLLASDHLRMTQSIAWSKSARWLPSLLVPSYMNHDQRMHMDYPNHLLTHPPPWDQPEAVEAIIYFDDWEMCGGATAFVPRRPDGEDEAYTWPYARMPGVAGVPWVNDRGRAEEGYRLSDADTYAFRKRLYDREVHAAYTTGSVFFYRHDTWHRGTPISPWAPQRRVLNVVLAKPTTRGYLPPFTCDLLVDRARPGVAVAATKGANEQCASAAAMYWGLSTHIEECGVVERTRLGVPPPGDRYWTAQMRQAMRARYPRMDVRPYDEASESSYETMSQR